MIPRLKAPSSLKIDFAPSARQYEVWKNLQPGCSLCGGNVVQVQNGVDRNGNPTYISVCEPSGNDNIPQIILGGGAVGDDKSYLGSCWLISSCLRWSDMRMAVA